MVKKWLLKSKHALGEFRDLLDERAFHAPRLKPLSRLQRFIHFWVLVWNSFSRNRGPARAAALAYTSLLALIPVAFVVVSVSTSILRQEGGERVTQFIDHLLVSITPGLATTSPSSKEPFAPGGANTNNAVEASSQTNLTPEKAGLQETNNASATNYVAAQRKELVHKVNDFIQNIQSGTLGVTGIAGLIIAAILMLRSIESTFNDIWGVTKGRSWWAQIMQYSAVLLLGPTLLAVALGLTSSRHLEYAREMVWRLPQIGRAHV